MKSLVENAEVEVDLKMKSFEFMAKFDNRCSSMLNWSYDGKYTKGRIIAFF